MIDFSKLTDPEEIAKHLHHVKNTMVDLENPIQFYKGKYRFEITYLGNMIYMLDTRVLDIEIDDFIKGNNK